ncbi:MAG: prolyl oligopeptidase family serine peptidase [Candidatus Thorarchaeota archaeon]|jgi:dipeptidyl aminopeptidase/acylaminoacyl peptidase
MTNELKVTKRRPTVKDMITRPFYFRPSISPDGKKVAYTKISLDLSTNGLFGKFYIYDVETKETHYVFADGSEIHWIDNDTYAVNRHSKSGNPRWSDICLVRNMIGEGVRVFEHPSRIGVFSPYMDGFVVQASKDVKKSRIGDFVHVENELPQTALFYVSTKRVFEKEEHDRLYFEEEDYTSPVSQFEITDAFDSQYQITSFVVSPKTNSIYINCQLGADLYYEYETVCFKVEFDPELVFEEVERTSLEQALSSLSFQELSLPIGFTVKAVSPDGSTLLVGGPVPGASVQPRNDLWLISDSDACGPRNEEDQFSHLRLISEKLDRRVQDIHWTTQGIYVAHWEKSTAVISKLSESGDFETFDLGKVSPRSEFSINDNGDFAFGAYSPTAMSEVYFGSLRDGNVSIERITRNTEDFAHLDFGTVESITWTSKDGTEIEGVLRKPSDFDPSKKYPLVLYPHGGPRGSSCLSLVDGEFAHPVSSLVARGVLILEPNYRGGVGRGRDFMNLNHGNLGSHDLWDLESGIDHLIEQGFVDSEKIGSMGGSQGGYLSAYIGMHTDRCAAVSVFAGVSSWYLYYIGSDARHTVHLDGTPFEPESRDGYVQSAPIAAIEHANTPMLLHHGANDERITVVSAQEMYRALKDKGVHTELFVLPGKGHGFINPRENYSISLHTYRWFCHFLLGEELDLFKDDF